MARNTRPEAEAPARRGDGNCQTLCRRSSAYHKLKVCQRSSRSTEDQRTCSKYLHHHLSSRCHQNGSMTQRKHVIDPTIAAGETPWSLASRATCTDKRRRGGRRRSLEARVRQGEGHGREWSHFVVAEETDTEQGSGFPGQILGRHISMMGRNTTTDGV